MIAVPAETPVTNPLLSTAAMDGFEDTQGKIVAAVPDPDNCDVVLTQAVKMPVTVGKAFTVKVDIA